MFRLNPFVRGGLCASAMSLALPVIAAESSDTMVVTASATEQNLKDAPASISVITQEDLQRKPVQNLKDVLREVPGVQLTSEGDNRKGVSIRGLDSSYTLILIDGKRVNSGAPRPWRHLQRSVLYQRSAGGRPAGAESLR